MTQTLPAKGQKITDLRRVGINPDFWYPVAMSAAVRKEKTFAATFAGQRIALYRGTGGAVYALEDRCAHRQVPLSMEARYLFTHAGGKKSRGAGLLAAGAGRTSPHVITIRTGYPQRAWDEQGQDRNHEVFPLILDLRDVLRSNGVPIRPDPGCATTPGSGAQR
jgi:hypothetical protein